MPKASNDTEYQSAERVLLLALLLQAESCTREGVFEQIPAYRAEASKISRRRMFERDLAQLERVGYRVVRDRRGPVPAIYRILRDEYDGILPSEPEHLMVVTGGLDALKGVQRLVEAHHLPVKMSEMVLKP